MSVVTVTRMTHEISWGIEAYLQFTIRMSFNLFSTVGTFNDVLFWKAANHSRKKRTSPVGKGCLLLFACSFFAQTIYTYGLKDKMPFWKKKKDIRRKFQNDTTRTHFIWNFACVIFFGQLKCSQKHWKNNQNCERVSKIDKNGTYR